MTQKVYLLLKIDGSDIVGESTISSLDRAGSIECLSFYYGLMAPRDLNSGRLTGRRQHEWVRIHKYIDITTPRLLSALCINNPVDSAEFRFFRLNSDGSGAEEHYFTVLLENGYISSVKLLNKDSVMDSNETLAMMEEVTFAFNKVTWTHEIGGVTDSDICWSEGS